jgi:hypothetical protein
MPAVAVWVRTRRSSVVSIGEQPKVAVPPGVGMVILGLAQLRMSVKRTVPKSAYRYSARKNQFDHSLASPPAPTVKPSFVIESVMPAGVSRPGVQLPAMTKGTV